MKKVLIVLLVVAVTVSSCIKNADWSFPDFPFSVVYFPNQSPIRTITLGEDIYDNTLDNQHKSLIMATMGGVYENKKDITMKVAVDNSLIQKLRFESLSGDQVIAMPSNYYTLPVDMSIVIPSGKMFGGIEVQLADAFFNDPRSIKKSFVIPLKITSVTGADSILVGQAGLGITSPDPLKSGDWKVIPKNYILYAVKYINPYHGAYLRRGIDQVKGNGNTALDTTIVYHKTYVEQDEVSTLFTKSMTEDTLSLSTRNRGSTSSVPFQLSLKFDNTGKCAVSGPAATASYSVTGTGEFVKKGDMWGNEKKDVLYLKYQVNFGTTTHNFSDTLVMRDRQVKFETFVPVIGN